MAPPDEDQQPFESPLPSRLLAELVAELEQNWMKLRPGSTHEQFEQSFFTEAVDKPEENVDARVSSVVEACANPNSTDASLIEAHLAVACAFCLLSDFYEANERPNDAWKCAYLAQQWNGFVLLGMSLSSREKPLDVMRTFSAKGNAQRHRETRELKDQAFGWLKNNYAGCDSKDAAAKEITKVVPVAFRTARRYVDQWLETIPSPGRT